eukprot:scaffold253040_cov39-Prasinocladus_malaysianus.AAC.1
MHSLNDREGIVSVAAAREAAEEAPEASLCRVGVDGTGRENLELAGVVEQSSECAKFSGGAAYRSATDMDTVELPADDRNASCLEWPAA